MKYEITPMFLSFILFWSWPEWKCDRAAGYYRILRGVLERGCNQVRDYLKTNPNVEKSDKDLCDGIGTQK